MGRNQPYCCICGGPMQEPGQRDEVPGVQWLTDAILLTTVHRTENGEELDEYWAQGPSDPYPLSLGPNPPNDALRSVLQLDSRCNDSNRFELESGKSVEAFYFEVYGSSYDLEKGSPFYLVVHKQCLGLANLFADSRVKKNDTFHMQPEDEISSIKQLWQVLHRRMPGFFTEYSQYILPDLFEYFGGSSCRNVYWERDDDPDWGYILEADPVDIPDLTQSVLKNIEPAPSDNLSQPIQGEAETKEIPKDWSDLKGSDINCTYTQSQDWWCETLVNKITFPWLWDLDVEAIDEKRRAGNWNWELLARKLSQVKIYEPDDSTLSLPLGLKNRRRIWRALAEARVDDVARAREAEQAAN